MPFRSVFTFDMLAVEGGDSVFEVLESFESVPSEKVANFNKSSKERSERSIPVKYFGNFSVLMGKSYCEGVREDDKEDGVDLEEDETFGFESRVFIVDRRS